MLSGGEDYTLALELFSFRQVEVHSPLEASTVDQAVVEVVDAVAFVLVVVGSIPVVEVEHAVAEGMAAAAAGMVVVDDLGVDVRVDVAGERQDGQIGVAVRQVVVFAILEAVRLLEVVDAAFGENIELVGLVADAGRLGPVEVNTVHRVVA